MCSWSQHGRKFVSSSLSKFAPGLSTICWSFLIKVLHFCQLVNNCKLQRTCCSVYMTLSEMLSRVIVHACTVELEIFYCAAHTCEVDIQSIVVKRDHAQLRWTSTKHRRGRISVDNRINKPLGHMAPSSPSPSSRVSSNIDLRQLELPGRGREESTHILVITQRSGKHCQMKSIYNPW